MTTLNDVFAGNGIQSEKLYDYLRRSSDTGAVSFRKRLLLDKLLAGYRAKRKNNVRTKLAMLDPSYAVAVTFTANPSGTGGTLSASITNGTYWFKFSNGETRLATVTTGTSVAWSPALSTTRAPASTSANYYTYAPSDVPQISLSTTTISQSGNQTSTGDVMYNNGLVGVYGGRANTGTTFRLKIDSTTVASSLTGGRVAFEFTGRYLQWVGHANNVLYEFMVDDQYVTTDKYNSSGSNLVIQLDWGANVDLGKRRRIEIPLSLDQDLGSVFWDATGTISPPQVLSPRILWCGDSIAASWYRDAAALAAGDTGYLWYANSVFTRLLPDYLGTSDVWPCALPGTGYVNTNTGSGYQNLGQRIQADIINSAPDVVVLHYSGHNDVGNNTQSTVLADLQTLQTQLPHVPKIVFDGILRQSDNIQATYVMNAVAQLNDPMTIGVKQVLATPPLQTGTGFQGSTTGTGQADWFFGIDDVHPTLSGHSTLAQDSADRFINAVAQALA